MKLKSQIRIEMPVFMYYKMVFAISQNIKIYIGNVFRTDIRNNLSGPTV